MSRANELVSKATVGMTRFTECGGDAACTCACGSSAPEPGIPTSLDASNAVLDTIDAGYGFEGVDGLFGGLGDEDDEDEDGDEYYEANVSADSITDDELLALADLSDDELAALAELEG